MFEWRLPDSITGEQADEIIEVVRKLDPDAHLATRYSIFYIDYEKVDDKIIAMIEDVVS